MPKDIEHLLNGHFKEFRDYRHEAREHHETSKNTNARIEAMHMKVNEVVPDLKSVATAIIDMKNGLLNQNTGLLNQNSGLVKSATGDRRMPTSVALLMILLLGAVLVLLLIKDTKKSFRIGIDGFQVLDNSGKPIDDQ